MLQFQDCFLFFNLTLVLYFQQQRLVFSVLNSILINQSSPYTHAINFNNTKVLLNWRQRILFNCIYQTTHAWFLTHRRRQPFSLPTHLDPDEILNILSSSPDKYMYVHVHTKSLKFVIFFFCSYIFHLKRNYL